MAPVAGVSLPKIKGHEDFDVVVKKLAGFFVEAVEAPHTFDELRSAIYGRTLKPLVRYLVDEVHYEGIIAALLALKWHFSQLEDDDDQGINHTRGLACELVAWRFVTRLTEREAVEYLCFELPASGSATSIANGSLRPSDEEIAQPTERSPLLDGAEDSEITFDEEAAAANKDAANLSEISFAWNFASLNALEVAAVADAKKFLSQKAMQRTIDGIWRGDIVFWDSLSTTSTKEARIYNRSKSDPYSRLKVPLYLKIFEVAFFAAFLAFYYIVLVEKNDRITAAEVMLYVWLAAFSYNELVEFLDAGTTFYATDFWALWDIAIIATGVAFFVARMIGLAKHDLQVIDTAFDILAVEALFLVPRLFSLLSLHPYFGMLLPAMKEMTKDFIKFLLGFSPSRGARDGLETLRVLASVAETQAGLLAFAQHPKYFTVFVNFVLTFCQIAFVAILYIGFDTCFTFLARGSYSLAKMNWILVKVFFGSGYLGFDIAEEISPILGPPLMFIFVCMTNILLITSLISLMSNSLSKVMEHSRDEYLFVYSVYVLEASTSNRLTYFIPPLNLLPLLLRPLRLVVAADRLRSVRIALLKATHWPFVALILAYERWRLSREKLHSARASSASLRGPRSPTAMRRSLSARQMQKPSIAARSALSPLAEEARPADSTMGKPVGAAFETGELAVAVSQLKAQLEEISALLAKTKSAGDVSG